MYGPAPLEGGVCWESSVLGVEGGFVAWTGLVLAFECCRKGAGNGPIMVRNVGLGMFRGQ